MLWLVARITLQQYLLLNVICRFGKKVLSNKIGEKVASLFLYFEYDWNRHQAIKKLETGGRSKGWSENEKSESYFSKLLLNKK